MEVEKASRNILNQGSAMFFYKGTGSKYFQICEPRDTCHCNSSHAQYLNVEAHLDSTKTT